MVNDILFYAGSVIIFIWGVAHLIPTKSVVNGFGKILEDNIRIITMEWIAAGLTLCFIGLISFIITYLGYSGDVVSILFYRLFAIMLIVLAIVSIFTGARTSILPNKICPVIMTIVAILFLLGTIL